MRRYQKGMVLMVEHILFAVLTAAVIGAAIFMWWFENHDEKTDSGNEKEWNRAVSDHVSLGISPGVTGQGRLAE